MAGTRPPESYEAEVVKFLQSVNASGIRSYVCTTASDDVFLEAKLLSIPVVMISIRRVSWSSSLLMVVRRPASAMQKM